MPWSMFEHYLQKYEKFFSQDRVPWTKPENIRVDDSIMTVVIKTKGGRFIKNEIPVCKSLFKGLRVVYATKGGVWGGAFASGIVSRLGVGWKLRSIGLVVAIGNR